MLLPHLALALIAAQDLVRLGVPPSEDAPFTVDLAVVFRAEAKDAPPLHYESSARILYTVRKADDGIHLQGRFALFSFAGDLGEGKVDVQWDETKKLEEVDWGTAKPLRDLVAGGFRIQLDAAGNGLRCDSDAARHLVMTLEPLLCGSASWLPGDARNLGDRWAGSSESADSTAGIASLYEKNEDGAAVVASTITLKDRKNEKAGTATGRATTRVDLKTGRPTGSTITLEMAGPGQTVKFEASASVIATKQP